MGSPTVIRYADDFVVLCHTRQEALEVKARLANWLTPRGLAFNEDKTRVVSLDEGFDFLGFNVRRYRGKPLIKPSKAAVRRIRERLRTELRSLRGTNAQAVIRRLNPIIRGWADYYRTQVSSETFDAGPLPMGAHLQVGQVQPPNKPSSWVVRQVLRQVQQGQAGPVGVRRPQQRRLHAPLLLDQHRPAQIVKHGASPDDPALADYWAWRRRKRPLPINNTSLRLYRAQDGRCAICKASSCAVEDQPQTPHQWETWLATTRTTIDDRRETTATRTRLNPVSSTPAATRQRTDTLPAPQPPGLA